MGRLFFGKEPLFCGEIAVELAEACKRYVFKATTEK